MPKIVRIEANHTGIQWTYLEVKRSKVKVARLCDAADKCWPISRKRNVPGRPKLVGRLSTPRAIMRPRFKVKDQRWRSSGRLMLRPEVRHISRTGRPTNFKLGIQTEHEDPYQRQALWSSRSNGDKSDPVIRRLNDVIEPKLSLLTLTQFHGAMTRSQKRMFTNSCTTMSWEQMIYKSWFKPVYCDL